MLPQSNAFYMPGTIMSSSFKEMFNLPNNLVW